MVRDLISVIVPVYNVELYLERCVESIIGQTYSNIEIILVDDGSPDNCGKICDRYAKKDKRIKVIHQKNQGLSAARNSGIKISKGKYLCFIDSDDYIADDMVEYLYSNAKRYNSDIAACGYTAIYENGNSEKITRQINDIVFSKEEALDLLLINGYIDVVAWNKLYKKELFGNIKYPVGKLYEDMYTSYKLINDCKKISLHPESKYFYCKRGSSIGGSSFSSKTMQSLDACDEVYKFAKKTCNTTSNIEIGRIQWYIVVVNKMILSNKIDKRLIKTVKKMIKDNLKNIIMTDKIDKTRKLQLIILFINLRLYCFVYKKYVGIKR